MSRYNLLYEPWIEVVDSQRLQTKISIMDLIESPTSYQRLSGETSPQDFAILRLLLSILETVFHRYQIDGSSQGDSKKDLHSTWKQLWKLESFPEIVQHYLKSQEDKFYLYDNQYPFMQVTKSDLDNYGIKKTGTISGKLMNRLLSESNNKVDLFAPTVDKYKNHLTDDELARWLVSLEGYTGTGDKAKYPGMTDSASRGWLLSIGGIYFQGDNLFQTLMLNLILDDTKEQHPIWEKSIDDKMDVDLVTEPEDLADLYTNQSRLIYMNPELQPNLDDVSIEAVQLPNIEPEFQVMEPMTLWKRPKSGKHKGEDVPKTHQPNQALWRSFSFLTIADDKSNDEKSRDAGLMKWYAEVIKQWVDTEHVKICAVGMAYSHDASSMPIGELYDEINVNPRVLIGSDTNRWNATIMNAVKDTKTAIYILKKFTSNVCHIRNTNADMPGVIEQEAYFAVDEPFKRWLSEINMDTDKNEHSERLRQQIFNILKQKAKSIIYPLTNRDLKGIVSDKSKEVSNSIKEYNKTIGTLRNILINQGGLK